MPVRLGELEVPVALLMKHERAEKRQQSLLINPNGYHSLQLNAKRAIPIQTME